MFKLLFFLFCCSSFVFMSCSDDNTISRLEYIKRYGDNNPALAMEMLDSLDLQTKSEYIKNKAMLLRTRLNDKLERPVISNDTIEYLVSYFCNTSKECDKQEVCYYAGRTYTYLQDTPRALEYFLKSLDYAKQSKQPDSVMIANSYSNLNDLYYRVQDYKAAVAMAQKEYEVCKQINKDLKVPLLHMGAAYMATDSIRQATAVLNEAYKQINLSNQANDKAFMVYLLYYYSELGKESMAKKCFKHVEDLGIGDNTFLSFAKAKYYNCIGNRDSTIYHANKAFETSNNIESRYDAAKILYKKLESTTDYQKANHYASIYMALSDSLDFGKRQEMSATVKNQYKYYLDKNKELVMKERIARYNKIMMFASFAIFFLLASGYIVYIKKKSRHLKEVLELSTKLSNVTDQENMLRASIKQKEHELQQLKSDMEDYTEQMKTNQQCLAEKIAQNKVFISLLHMSELEENAQDVVDDIKKSSVGRKELTSADWKRLYQAVDSLYPNLKETMIENFGKFTELQMQFCYLYHIGLSSLQIQNITGLSRATVWRWMKKYNWTKSQ